MHKPGRSSASTVCASPLLLLRPPPCARSALKRAGQITDFVWSDDGAALVCAKNRATYEQQLAAYQRSQELIRQLQAAVRGTGGSSAALAAQQQAQQQGAAPAAQPRSTTKRPAPAAASCGAGGEVVDLTAPSPPASKKPRL